MIQKEYTVITSGVGAVSNYSNIDPSQFSAAYNKGDRQVFMTQLPTSETAGVYLTGEYKKWAEKASNSKSEKKRAKYSNRLKEAGVNYYVVDIDFQYSVNIEDGMDVSKASDWVAKDPASRGIIGMGVDPDKYNLSFKGPVDFQYKIFNEAAMSKHFVEVPTALAAGSIKRLSDYDIIIINPKYWDSNAKFNIPIKDETGTIYNSTVSRTNALVHEAGHNSTDLSHEEYESNGTPYTYDKTGLQNNTNNNVYPTYQNIITILNNENNRSTINETPKE